MKLKFKVQPYQTSAVESNVSVRNMLGQHCIKPEKLPPEDDIRKMERRVKSEEKKLEKQSGKLPKPKDWN